VVSWVYDPFLGSGTSLAADRTDGANLLRHRMDPKYVDVIVQRWQTLGGKSAKLDGQGLTFAEVAGERRKAAL
jgi:DNA modification methylase